MSRHLFPVIAAAVLISGCHDSTRPRDLTPPAPPRALYSVTGDHAVYLSWLDNTESDVAGYRVFDASCFDCDYEQIGATTEASFTVTGLPNGVTRFYAVAAYDHAGNESELSLENVFDTPRPEGSGRALDNYLDSPATAGYDFSAYLVRPSDHTETDIYFGTRNGLLMMIAPFQDTEIQDAGYATSLDAVDFAPVEGWSPSGTVELVDGHCYVLLTHDDSEIHYAKFRVTSLSAGRVVFDWAYQVDPRNRELRARPVRREGSRERRNLGWTP